MADAAGRRSDGGPSPHPEISKPGYVEATSWLRETCSRLGPAQMVHGPHFSLLDSMGAIQAMEPRMDSGIYPLPDHLVADSDRPPQGMERGGRFSPFDELSAEDICWIMDRALAAEVAWHRGGTLSQTVCTCLLAHQLPQLQSSSSSLLAPSIATPSSSRPVPALTRQVLVPYLVGLLKSFGLAWDELIRGNVVDGEDFSSDPAGLDLQPSLDPEEVVEQLEAAMRWIQVELKDDGSGRDALIARLSLRRSILLCLSRLTLYSIRAHRGSHDLSSQVVMLRSTISILSSAAASSSSTSLRDPSLRSAPSPAALRSFDPYFSRRVASAGGSGSGMPPPKPVQLEEPEETLRFYCDLADGLGVAATLLERPSWTGWKRSITDLAIHFQARQTSAYLRSIVQSIIYQERGCVFSLESLDWIAESFLVDVVGVPMQLLALAAESPNADSGTGSQLSYFSERLASQLVNFLCALSQNRARGKRVLGKLYTSSVALAEDAAQLGRRLSSALPSMHQDLLFAALQHLSLNIVFLTLSANVELSLLSRSEWTSSYWLLARVAREQLSVLSDLRSEVGEGRLEDELPRAGLGGWRGRGKRRAEVYLDEEIGENRIRLAAAEAYLKLVTFLDRQTPSIGWPCSLQDMDSAEALSRGHSIHLLRPRQAKPLPPLPVPVSDDEVGKAPDPCLASKEQEEEQRKEAAEERRQALRREIWCRRAKWLVNSSSSSSSSGSASTASGGVVRDEEALILWAEFRREEERLGGVEREALLKEACHEFERAGAAARELGMGAGRQDGEREGTKKLRRLFEANVRACKELLAAGGSELMGDAKDAAAPKPRLDFDDGRSHPWWPLLVIDVGLEQ